MHASTMRASTSPGPSRGRRGPAFPSRSEVRASPCGTWPCSTPLWPTAGVAKQLSWTKAQAEASPDLKGRRLVRSDAAEQVLAILRESPPPADRPPPALSVGAPPLAFKTGTSYGFRDAVAAGVGDGYVIVVWTGRPDGGSRQGLTGRSSALPLLFQCFDALESQSSAPRALPPPEAPHALTSLEDAKPAPRMVFPPDGSRVIVDQFGAKGRGLTLAATGEALTWYVDGAKLPADPLAIKPVWRPPGPGFYRITAVDDRGRRLRGPGAGDGELNLGDDA